MLELVKLDDGEQVMVDLETMSTEPDAAVIAIGAQKFYMDGTKGGRFYINVDLRDCVRRGLRMDPDTVMWWLEQSESARKALLVDPKPLDVALSAFNAWLGDSKFCLWGNGVDFDNVILGNAYKVSGVARPWSYRDNRCYKTVKALLGEGVEAPPSVGTEHNALDDAEFQVDYLLKMLGHDELRAA